MSRYAPLMSRKQAAKGSKSSKGAKTSKRAKTSKGAKTSKHRTLHGRTAVKAKSQTRTSSRSNPNSKPVNQRGTSASSSRNQERLLTEATRELMSLGSGAFTSLE